MSGAGHADTVKSSLGHLLDGRLIYQQPTQLYRTGIEPVLLAAAVPARAGQRVLELGTGAGAALLCLAWRLPEVRGVGIEAQAELVDLAGRNFAANRFADRLSVIAGDIASAPDAPFDHAFANPPWHAETGTASPHPGRDLARRARGGLLAAWTAAMSKRLRPRGTLTLILPAASLHLGMQALSDSGCGAIATLPLWPKPGHAARIVILQAIKAGEGCCRILPGLVLHQQQGGFTAEADAILRSGAALPWTG